MKKVKMPDKGKWCNFVYFNQGERVAGPVFVQRKGRPYVQVKKWTLAWWWKELKLWLK